MSDAVLVEGLEVECIVGLYEWEQRRPRRLLIDLLLEADIAGAALNDAMADGVDYGAVCARVTEVCQSTRYRLLETLAEHIARELLAGFALLGALELTIRKPGAVPTARNVGVRIRRSR